MSLQINRSVFIKDLLSPNSLCKNVDTFEFKNVKSFLSILSKKEILDISKSKTWIINLSNSQDIIEISKILYLDFSNKYLVLRITNFSLDLLNSLKELLVSNFLNIFICIDIKDIEEFSTFFYKNVIELSNFISIFDKIEGIINITISSNELNNIFSLLSETFFKLPFFSKVWINWIFSDLEDIYIRDIKKLDVQIFWLKENLIGREISWSFNRFVKKFYFDFWNPEGYKKIYVNEDSIYIEREDFKETKVSLYEKKDCNNILLSEIDHIRSFYDMIFNETCGLNNLNLISFYENFKTFKTVSLLPYSCKIIDKLL